MLKEERLAHRHAILRDEISEERINLLNTIRKDKGEMTIYNSYLSEYGVLGFDYGYAMAASKYFNNLGSSVW